MMDGKNEPIIEMLSALLRFSPSAPTGDLRILALDPATKCGFAHSCGISGTWDLSVRRDESSGMRLLRLRGKLNEILSSVGIDLIVYEAARHAAPKMQGALVVQATIQGALTLWAEERKIQYRGVSPKEIKKLAAGSGNANKQMVIAAAAKRWPSVDITDDNHADALWILEFAKLTLGTPL